MVNLNKWLKDGKIQKENGDIIFSSEAESGMWCLSWNCICKCSLDNETQFSVVGIRTKDFSLLIICSSMKERNTSERWHA